MGCMIVFVILLVIGIGILCFLTGDMTAFIALAATLVIGLGLAGLVLADILEARGRAVVTVGNDHLVLDD